MEANSRDETERIIQGNNLIWDQIFFDESTFHNNWSFQGQSRTDLDILNCGSLVKDVCGLENLTKYSLNKNIPGCLWTDPVSKLKLTDLENLGYQIDLNEVEVWRALDLKKELSDPKIFIKKKHILPYVKMESIKIPIQSPSKQIIDSIKITTNLNNIPELNQYVFERTALPTFPGISIYLLLLSFHKKVSSVAMLGIYQKFSYFFLASTIESDRGLGFSPALRIFGATLAQKYQCQKMITNTDLKNSASLKGSSETGSTDLFLRHLWKQKKGHHL